MADGAITSGNAGQVAGAELIAPESHRKNTCEWSPLVALFILIDGVITSGKWEWHVGASNHTGKTLANGHLWWPCLF